MHFGKEKIQRKADLFDGVEKSTLTFSIIRRAIFGVNPKDKQNNLT